MKIDYRRGFLRIWLILSGLWVILMGIVIVEGGMFEDKSEHYSSIQECVGTGSGWGGGSDTSKDELRYRVCRELVHRNNLKAEEQGGLSNVDSWSASLIGAIMNAILLLAIVPATLFIIGSAVGWIAQGFTSTKDSDSSNHLD